MSFKPSQAERDAVAKQNQMADLSLANSKAATAQGNTLFGMGLPQLNSGTGFYQTLLNGNRANTTAALMPNIQQVREGTADALQTANNLMPRGGGRSGALFDLLTRPSGAITGLFNQARVAAPQPLINAGLSATGQAPALFGQGTQSLGLATNTQGDIRDYEMRQRQMKNQFFSSLGSGLFNLATVPFGGSGLFGMATKGLAGGKALPGMPG